MLNNLILNIFVNMVLASYHCWLQMCVVFFCINPQNIKSETMRLKREKTTELSDILNVLLNEVYIPVRINFLTCWDLGKSIE